MKKTYLINTCIPVIEEVCFYHIHVVCVYYNQHCHKLLINKSVLLERSSFAVCWTIIKTSVVWGSDVSFICLVPIRRHPFRRPRLDDARLDDARLDDAHLDEVR